MTIEYPIPGRTRIQADIDARNERDLRDATTVESLTQLLLPFLWEARMRLAREEEEALPVVLRRVAMSFKGGFLDDGPLRLRRPAVLAAAAAFDGTDRTEYDRARRSERCSDAWEARKR